MTAPMFIKVAMGAVIHSFGSVPPVLFCGMSGGGNVKQAGFSFGLSKEV